MDSMRKPLIAGNWKMNKTNGEAVSLVKDLKKSLKSVKDKDILIFPPFTSLKPVYEEIKDSNIKLGAQNMHFEKEGAFTGEISPIMVKDIGCDYVILGHSERRQYFDETDEVINKKIKAAFQHNLSPILCIGESLKQRKNNETFDAIKNQLNDCLKDIDENEMKKITIAYEPIWAIGTGVNATPEQAEEVHLFIRELLSSLCNDYASEKIRILYGGSVKPDNIKGLMQKENIDGVLVGGASLDAESFSKIVNY